MFFCLLFIKKKTLPLKPPMSQMIIILDRLVSINHYPNSIFSFYVNISRALVRMRKKTNNFKGTKTKMGGIYIYNVIFWKFRQFNYFDRTNTYNNNGDDGPIISDSNIISDFNNANFLSKIFHPRNLYKSVHKQKLKQIISKIHFSLIII